MFRPPSLYCLHFTLSRPCTKIQLNFYKFHSTLEPFLQYFLNVSLIFEGLKRTVFRSSYQSSKPICKYFFIFLPQKNLHTINFSTKMDRYSRFTFETITYLFVLCWIRISARFMVNFGPTNNRTFKDFASALFREAFNAILTVLPSFFGTA